MQFTGFNVPVPPYGGFMALCVCMSILMHLREHVPSDCCKAFDQAEG